MSRHAQRPRKNPSAFTAGEVKPALGIAAIFGFMIVVALVRVFGFYRVADANAAHPLNAFNAALTGLR